MLLVWHAPLILDQDSTSQDLPFIFEEFSW